MSCPCSGRCAIREAGDGRVHPSVFRRGRSIFRAGEAVESAYVVRSGAVKTYVVRRDGEVRITAFAGPGDVIGLEGLDDEVRTSSAVALDTSSVCHLNLKQLWRGCSGSPHLAERLFRQLSHSMLEQQALSLILGCKSADQRLAAFILTQSTKQARLGLSASEVNLAMTRVDIGRYLALAVETVSRVFTRLDDEGVLLVQRNRVRIVDRDALAAIAGEPLPRSAARGNGSISKRPAVAEMPRRWVAWGGMCGEGGHDEHSA